MIGQKFLTSEVSIIVRGFLPVAERVFYNLMSKLKIGRESNSMGRRVGNWKGFINVASPKQVRPAFRASCPPKIGMTWFCWYKTKFSKHRSIIECSKTAKMLYVR